LHYACQNGHVDVVELLIESSANMEEKTQDQWTPLHVTSENAHMKIVEMLISKGADIEAKTKYLWTPLHVSCQNGCVNVAELLISKGADIEAKTNNKRTPLYVATIYGEVDVVELLLSKNVDIEAKPKSDSTAFISACLSGNEPISKLLLSKGANVNKLKDGHNPLFLVALIEYLLSPPLRNRYTNMVNLLIQYNAEPKELAVSSSEERFEIISKYIENLKEQNCTKISKEQILFCCSDCPVSLPNFACLMCAISCHKGHTLNDCQFKIAACTCLQTCGKCNIYQK